MTEQKTPASGVDYDAFLSYSTRSDYRRVRQVKLFLERFHRMDPGRVDHAGTAAMRPLKACVDGIDFKRPRGSGRAAGAVEAPLWELIDSYLAASRFLVVICSPETSASPFVSNEIRHFCQLHNDPTGEGVLLAVAGGDPQAAPHRVFPAAALELGLHEREAWIDLRSRRTGGEPERGIRDQNEELVRLAEILLGVERGTLVPLYYREQRRLARRRLLATAAVATVVTAFAALASWQWLLAQFSLLDTYASLAATEATRTTESDPAYALALAEYSLRVGNQRSGLALVDRIARELPAHATYGDVDPVTEPRLFVEQPAGTVAFLRGGRSLIAWTQGSRPSLVRLGEDRDAQPLTTEPVGALAVNRAGTVIALSTANAGLQVFAVDEGGQPKEILRVPGRYRALFVREDGDMIGAVTEDHVSRFFQPARGPSPIYERRDVVAMAFASSSFRAAVLVSHKEGSHFELIDLSSRRQIRRIPTDILRRRLSIYDEYRYQLAELSSGGSRIESLAGPIDPLDITGWLTAAIRDTVASESGEKLEKDLKSIESRMDRTEAGQLGISTSDIRDFARERIARQLKVLASKKNLHACAFSLAFLADDTGLIAWCAGGPRLPFEIVDLLSGRAVHSQEGFFSLLSVHPSGRAVSLAGPKLIRLDLLSLRPDGEPLVSRGVFPPASLSGRIGVPRVFAFGPRGKYLATAYAPYLQMQGAPPATLVLALTGRSDTRDGNSHQQVVLQPNHHPISALGFDAKGSRLAALYANGAVRIWNLAPENEIERALPKFALCGFRYMPVDAAAIDGTTFASIDDLGAALKRITRRRLSASESVRLGLPAEPNGALLTLKGLVSRAQAEGQIQWPIQEDPGDGCPWLGPKGNPNVIAVQSGFHPLERAQCFSGRKKAYDASSCNLGLQQLVRDILLGGMRFSEAAKRYWALLEKDPMLASGLQARASADRLKAGLSGRAEDIVVLALAGDRLDLPALQAAGEEGANSYELAAKRWAVGFLTTHGRDTSVGGFLKVASPKSLTAVDYLAWPTNPPNVRPNIKIIPAELTGETREALMRNSTIEWRASLSTPAFGLLAIGKELPRLHYLASEYFAQAKDYDTAWKFIDAALASGPQDPQYLNWAGFILLRRGSPGEALPYFERSIASGRTDGWPHINMARALAKLGQRENAERAYEFLLSPKIQPRMAQEYSEHLQEFAEFLRTSWPADQLRNTKARGLLARSIVLSEDPEPILTLAEWMAEDGHADKAAALLDAAGKKFSDPEHREKIESIRRRLTKAPRP